MSDFDLLLKTCYDTSVFGDGLFGGLAKSETDEDRAEKFRLLQRVIGRNHETLAPYIAARGGTTREKGSALAESIGANAHGQDWDEVMKGIYDLGPHLLDQFVQCRRHAPTEDEAEAVGRLIRDQATIMAFAALETAGRGEAARLLLLWQLEV